MSSVSFFHNSVNDHITHAFFSDKHLVDFFLIFIRFLQIRVDSPISGSYHIDSWVRQNVADCIYNIQETQRRYIWTLYFFTVFVYVKYNPSRSYKVLEIVSLHFALHECMTCLRKRPIPSVRSAPFGMTGLGVRRLLSHCARRPKKTIAAFPFI